jgi:hypothetical protein
MPMLAVRLEGRSRWRRRWEGLGVAAHQSGSLAFRNVARLSIAPLSEEDPVTVEEDAWILVRTAGGKFLFGRAVPSLGEMLDTTGVAHNVKLVWSAEIIPGGMGDSRRLSLGDSWKRQPERWFLGLTRSGKGIVFRTTCSGSILPTSSGLFGFGQSRGVWKVFGEGTRPVEPPRSSPGTPKSKVFGSVKPAGPADPALWQAVETVNRVLVGSSLEIRVCAECVNEFVGLSSSRTRSCRNCH